MATMLEKWQAMPIKTWNVTDKKFGKKFTVEAKTRAAAIGVLMDRWMLSQSETELRALVSVVREPKK